MGDVAEQWSWSRSWLGVPRDGQVRQDRPRDADLIRHHNKTCRRKVAEPSLVRRVTTARVFHESAEELPRLLGPRTRTDDHPSRWQCKATKS